MSLFNAFAGLSKGLPMKNDPVEYELKEYSAAYRYLKHNIKPEYFEQRLIFFELEAEDKLKDYPEWMTVVMLVPEEESVTGYPFCVVADKEDFR